MFFKHLLKGFFVKKPTRDSFLKLIIWCESVGNRPDAFLVHQGEIVLEMKSFFTS